MKQTDFRFDARKKMLRGKEVFDDLALGCRVEPREGAAAKGRVSVNFPPELERVERRLRAGHVPHERQAQRHPGPSRLLSIVFEQDMAASASVLVTADHGISVLQFRLAGLNGLGIANTAHSADQLNAAVLDELAKLIVGQPSRFL